MNIERLLLREFGFTDDGAIDVRNQLKIFKIIKEINECPHPYSHRRYKIEIDYCSYCKTILNINK